ncbi:flagellar FlbD family protein [Bacillus bombysepticus]|uniref:flagellar FlbD family protein n=1 Tax=Bacillus bombysepticus TaxID=658666 RepID=UPI0030185689
MIRLTIKRAKGMEKKKLFNHRLIKHISLEIDTTIELEDGEKIIVEETADEIYKMIVAFEREIRM